MAWPFSIYRSYKSKSSEGKSVVFLFTIVIGYASGIVNKLIYNPDGVVYLYILNLVMVSVDIALYYRNRRIAARKL